MSPRAGSSLRMSFRSWMRCARSGPQIALQVARAGASQRDTKAPPILPLSSRFFIARGADKLIPGNQRSSRPLRPVYIAMFLPREVVCSRRLGRC
jgi:hypothetical protein